MKVLKILVLLLLFLIAGGCELQNKMLYYPDHSIPSPRRLASDGLAFWPAGPEGYRGFVSLSGTASRGTIIIFHGNAGTAFDRAFYVQVLTPLGFRVVLAEYPGYGGREGALGEASFVDDAAETMGLAAEAFGKPLFLLGESLGCGVAAGLARKVPDLVSGVVLITPWDTLRSIASKKFPWLPVRLLLSDQYDNIENLRSYPGKIAIAGADLDEIIPIQHATKLYTSLTGAKKMWTIRNAGHNDWPDIVNQEWWKEVTDYISF